MEIGSITFDNTISEEYKFSSNVTSYPVERGTVVSDHIMNMPDTIILTGLVTDTPLSVFATFNRSISVFNSLIDLHERREVVTVQTGLKRYDNMAITSIDVPRTVKTGQTLTFTIELQKIVFSDLVNVARDPFNLQAGFQSIRSNEIIASNTQYPLLQFDSPTGLKDQASTTNSVGVQTLQAIPLAAIGGLFANRKLILGR